MKTIEEIYRERLAILIAEAGTQANLSKVIDKGAAQISQWLNGSPDSKTGKPRVMSREVARDIERKLNKPVGWMDQPITTEDNPDWASWGSSDDKGVQSVTDQALPNGATSDIVIPQYDSGGSMGGGRLLLADQPGLIKSWHVDHEWIRLNVRQYTSLSNLCIVTGFGPSMKPMFNPGDPLLVDLGVKNIDHDAIFFFRVGDEGYIKQLQRIPDPAGDGKIIRAKSKNPDYDPFDILPSNPHFEIIGKVLTVWKSDQF